MTDPLPVEPASIRLSRRVVELCQCSRSVAEMYIEGGWVRVDGMVVEEPQFQVGLQAVTLDPDAQAVPLRPVTLIAHKPLGMPSERLVDPREPWVQAGNRSALDQSAQKLLKRHCRQLQLTLPLDVESCGLTVLTQEAGVLRKLTQTHPGPEQEYLIDLGAEPAPAALERLRQPASAGPYRRSPIKVSLQSEARLRMVGKALAPESIRAQCQQAGLQVSTIKRIRIGSVSMARLASGEWRYLSEAERF
ncbi:MAG: RNA pseudouridine synthase [Lysobacterales bacterium]